MSWIYLICCILNEAFGLPTQDFGENKKIGSGVRQAENEPVTEYLKCGSNDFVQTRWISPVLHVFFGISY